VDEDAALGLTREELIDVALLDVLADGEPLPVDAVVEEVREWLADHEAWSPDVWPLLELVPAAPELTERVRALQRMGMVRPKSGGIEITRAGHQMWDGFPWEYFSEEDQDDDDH
jgi:hypothetical protein